MCSVKARAISLQKKSCLTISLRSPCIYSISPLHLLNIILYLRWIFGIFAFILLL